MLIYSACLNIILLHGHYSYHTVTVSQKSPSVSFVVTPLCLHQYAQNLARENNKLRGLSTKNILGCDSDLRHSVRQTCDKDKMY